MCNYSILGLKSGATVIEIKAKFRSLSKQLHPDINGGDKSKTDRFIAVLAAYEALLKGDSGEKKVKQNFYQKESRKPKVATYRFEGIKKDDVGYIISFYVEEVNRIVIRGKNGEKIGTYNTEGREGIVRLEVLFKAAKEAKYIFNITLLDKRGNWATVTYKVKNPSMWGRIKEKISDIF